MSEKHSLVWIDYVIIVITLCVSSGVGFYYNFTERQKNAQEYFTVAESMSAFPIGIAMMAVIISPITTLGLASEIYTYGMQFSAYVLGLLIAMSLIGYLYIPVFYKLQATSMNMQLKGAAPDRQAEVLCIGGIKAVIVSDILQGVLMIGADIIILVITIPMLGGFEEIVRISEEGGRIQYDKFIFQGVFFASLSTISAISNSLAAIFLEDYLKPVYKKSIQQEIPKSRELIIGKILTFVIVVGIIGTAIVAQYLAGILEGSLTVSVLTNGTVFGLFTLEMIFESATERGAIIGVFTSMAFCTWMATGFPRPTSSPKLPISIDGCNANIDVNDIIDSTFNLPNNETLESKMGYSN
ncbi:putative sodium-dependent multivitamin transporter [Belonocnema kinseyi]|uniref:putative sodium-dependent multivitamin transporter n=1 Tax=Belonocnema kinseyi TaxID=2817044 RepID=UPI00143D6DC2|nr:putative sodium-dependent multivitamin transporter [Belonocnema kinseyi]